MPDTSMHTDHSHFPLISRHVAITVLWCLVSATSLAAPDDRNQPIHVEADRMQYDAANQVSRFFGNVVASQGTLVIRAAQMEVRQDQAGNEVGVASGSAQRRAFFRQDRANTNEHIEGEALRLEYDSRTSTLKLIGDATVRRYRGNELWDQTSGGVITYNDKTSFFTVESGRNSRSPNGRVTAVFTPEPENQR